MENYDFDKNGSFLYLDECHTSVVGLRELVPKYDIFGHADFKTKLRKHANGLATFPAMSNYNGQKYPIEEWIEECHDLNFNVLLDAASFVSTNPLDLSKVQADFIALSFYKIFGYPTGLGALIVKNSSIHLLKKKYFAGGTVEMHLVKRSGHVGKSAQDNFEDGTLHFQGILALKSGLDFIKKFDMKSIALHTFYLGKYLYDTLVALKYANGQNVVEIYASNQYQNPELQGGIVNFNILHANQTHFGFTEFRKIAIHNKLVVRVGCFCNIGSCQKYLDLTDQDIESNHAAGHICGDNVDIINGKPTGSIRVSFGHYSKKEDADLVVQIIKDHFMIESRPVANGYLKSKQPPKISAIYLYPIKSCAPLRISNGSWPLEDTCLRHDRQFVIMQGKSTLTQKRESRLCQIKPDIDVENQVMILSAPWETSTCHVALDQDSETHERLLCSGKVCGDNIDGSDCGDEVAQWLEQVLDLTGLRLIQLSSRKSKKPKQNLQSLANEAQFLILNRNSAQDLRNESQDLDWMLEQFRGNIVIDNCEAYAEETWKTIQIGNLDLSLEVIGPCTRCNIIGIDQSNSERVQEPLESLAKSQTRRFKFGILAGSKTSMKGKVLQIGDEVKVSLQ